MFATTSRFALAEAVTGRINFATRDLPAQNAHVDTVLRYRSRKRPLAAGPPGSLSRDGVGSSEAAERPRCDLPVFYSVIPGFVAEGLRCRRSDYDSRSLWCAQEIAKTRLGVSSGCSRRAVSLPTTGK